MTRRLLIAGWLMLLWPAEAPGDRRLPGAAGAVEPAGGLVIPRPDLSAMEPGPRRKIEAVQNALEGLLAEGDLGRPELREGFGFLGQLFHAFEKLDAALICYQNAASLGARDHRWPYYLGLVRTAGGDLEGAEADYRRALELAPDRPATLLRLGNVALELGRAEEARRLFEGVLDLDPESAAALYGAGRASAMAGDAGTAAELFERVLALEPEASAVHYPLGQAYRALGELDRARSHLERRGDRQPSFEDPLMSGLAAIVKTSALEVVVSLAAQTEGFSEESFLGFVLSQFADTPGAVDRLEERLAGLGDDPGATPLQRARIAYAIGGLLVGVERDVDAIAYFQQAVAGAPGLRDARVKLGNAQARVGQFADSLAAYDGALELLPDDAAVLRKRATALANLERLGEAQADLERAVELDEDDPQGWLLLAGVRERIGDPGAAAATLEAALEKLTEPRDRMALHVELGDLYRGSRRYQSAAREYLKALRVDETHVPALSRLASLLGQLREFRPAAEVYRRWIAEQPANPQARMGEATALIMAGEYATARDRLESGLAVLPESLDLKDVLARHLAACPDPAVRDGRRALELARELYDRVPTLESVETLAMAFAQAGRYEDAVTWQERLLEDAPDDTAAALVERWRANLARYRDGRPCCATRRAVAEGVRQP